MADARTLFVLLESAAGYALFEVVAFDEIGGLLEGAMDTVTDLQRFGRAVKLKAFSPFESAAEALENANAISEHAMSRTLHNFLEMNLPKSSSKKANKKTAAFVLGVIDPGLATAISDGLGTSCRSDDTVRELIRGCRLHLDTFVKGLADGASSRAQLGLGHAYSRSKVKFNPARSDNMIIQSIALLDQLDKDVNTFAMRVREWYSWHFPELKDIVKDNIIFARAAALIQDKNSLLSSAAGESTAEEDDAGNGDHDSAEKKLAALTEIVGDAETAKAVMAAARTSMGMDCSSVDMINIVNFTQRMVRLAEFRKQLSLYLTDKMSIVAPNLSALIGDTVAARLISKAGSLTNLAKAPASTVQILGAEKALFRALKTKGNTPKYGLIYHSTFIGRAEAKNKGRISRYLANKCSIATRIDSFSDAPTRIYGEKLREQVEERLKFYETGESPRRNIDVMESVARELSSGKSSTKKKDKEVDDVDEEEVAEVVGSKEEKKAKKKDKKRISQDEAALDGSLKKKRKSSEMDLDADDKDTAPKSSSEEKKKSKMKSDGGAISKSIEESDEKTKKEKKKKKRKSESGEGGEDVLQKSSEKKKKKKKSKGE